MLGLISHSLLSIIYPQECGSCAGPVDSRDDGPACSFCWQKTRQFKGDELLCAKCGALMGTSTVSLPVNCSRCREHTYDRAFACGVYEHALRAAVIGLKSIPRLHPRTKQTLFDGFAAIGSKGDELIVPVPLSRQRRLERGYNQADIIGEVVGREFGVEVDAFSLARKINTPVHRVGMDDRARELTVRNAFAVLRPRLIEGRNIILVDDVFTSGATASACAAILKKKGACRVDVFTLARAVMK